MTVTNESKVDLDASIVFWRYREPEGGWEYSDDVMYRGRIYKIVYGGHQTPLPRIPTVGEEVELRYHEELGEPALEDQITYQVVGIQSRYHVIRHDERGAQLGYSVNVFMRPADKF